MSWIVSAKQYIPAVIGEPWGGGYFAGYISHTADGNPTHALIVAPRATGATGTGYTLTTDLAWKTTTTTTAGTTSTFDGAANTAAMVTAGIADHPAAQFCTNLSIGGFTDWYLPAVYEFDIAYFNLKPDSDVNSSEVGQNQYSVPLRASNYTLSYPTVTSVDLFKDGGSEAFVASPNATHWASTETSAAGALYARSNDGFWGTNNKVNLVTRVRAFRRIAL